MLIDVSMNASPMDGLIVTEDRFFLKPRESGSLEAPMPFIRARVSVRRASGLVQVPITLKIPRIEYQSLSDA
jgi:hypothetical protein